MKTAQLLHNPNAGDGSMGKTELVSLIESKGFKCIYTSTQEKDWEIEQDIDFIIVAGGDGTVRKVAKCMLRANARRVPIALLPMGTANNISKSLKLKGDVKSMVTSWQKWNIKKYDTTNVVGLEKPMFFLESIGFGIFPYLMKKINEQEEKDLSPEEELKWVQKRMRKIVRDYKGRKCNLKIDGIKHSGRFLMVEVMNTASVGANLHLNPSGNVGDNELEVVLLKNKHRKEFAQYLKDKVKGIDEPFDIIPLKGRSVQINWKGRLCHVDDEMLEIKKDIKIDTRVQYGTLDFLI